jgi:hypothetical protein
LQSLLGGRPVPSSPSSPGAVGVRTVPIRLSQGASPPAVKPPPPQCPHFLEQIFGANGKLDTTALGDSEALLKNGLTATGLALKNLLQLSESTGFQMYSFRGCAGLLAECALLSPCVLPQRLRERGTVGALSTEDMQRVDDVVKLVEELNAWRGMTHEVVSAVQTHGAGSAPAQDVWIRVQKALSE